MKGAISGGILCPVQRIGNESVQIHWHSSGSLGWPFPMLKYKYIFELKYTEAIISNSIRKLLWFEISKKLVAILKILCHLL